MKRLVGYCILLILNLPALSAQHTDPRFRIAPWANDKKAAVSLTFDDAISGQFATAVPMLNAHHFKATFFVTTKTLVAQMGDWHLVQAAAAAGHEIANHALTHPHFNALPADSIALELLAANKLITDSAAPEKSVTHAYPYGEGGQETSQDIAARTVVKKFFIGARATRNQPLTFNNYGFASHWDDYFKINSDMIADSASMAGFATQLDASIAAGGWYVPTYHGIVNGWIIVPRNIFNEHLQALEKRKGNIWIAPFVNVIKYHQERNCATLRVIREDQHSLVVQLTDTLNNSATWNQPLTIHYKTGSRRIKMIRQGTRDIPFSTTATELVFEALPGKDSIILTKQ